MEIPNHLSADTGLDRNGLDWLNAEPSKDISYRSGTGLSHCLEECVAFGIDEADRSLLVAGVEADPIAQVPWHFCSRVAFASFACPTDLVGSVRLGFVLWHVIER